MERVKDCRANFAGSRRIFRGVVACAVCAAAMWMTCAAQAQTEEQNVQQILMLLRLDEYGRSLKSVDKMLAATPHDCRLLSLRGLALNGLGRPVEALGSFMTALKYCPDNLLALEGAAMIEYARRQPDTAELLQRILKLQPDAKAAHAMLALTYRAKGECTKALPHFAASTQLFAQRPKYQQAYAYCLAKMGDYKQAAANYEQILGSDQDEAARYNLAVVEWRMHDANAALKTLDPLLARSHDEVVLALGAGLYRARAEREMKLGRRDAAVADLKSAQRLEKQLAGMRKAHAPEQKEGHRYALMDEMAR